MKKHYRAGEVGRSGKSKDRPAVAKTTAAMRFPVYLSNSILVLAGFILFAPLVTSNDFYYPDIFLKSILFRVAAQLMVLLYVVLVVLSPSHRPRFNRIICALLAYFGLMLISSLPWISVDAWSSWWGDFTRMGGMFTQLHLLAYFFVLAQTFKRERDWVALFTASLFFGILMGFSGLVQQLHLDYIRLLDPGDPRIRGATGNPIHFAAHMLLNLMIVLWFVGRKDRQTIYPLMAKCWFSLLILLDVSLLVWDTASTSGAEILSKGASFFPIILFALILHAISLCWLFMRNNLHFGRLFLGLLGFYFFFWMYQSQTRGAMVGVLVSLAALLVLYLWAGSNKTTRWTSALIGLLVVLIVSIIVINRQSSWIQSHSALSRFVSISYEGALKSRSLAWKAAVRGMLHRPVYGWGLENYKNAFDLYFPPPIFADPTFPEVWYDRAHNVVLDIGTMTGFPGLMSFLIFYGLVFVFLMRRWFRTKDTASALIATLLLAYLIQALSSFDSVNTDGIEYLVLAYIAYLYGPEKNQLRETSKQTARATPVDRNWVIFAAVVLILLPAYRYLVQKPYQSNRLLRSAIEREKVLDPNTHNARMIFDEEVVSLFRNASEYQTTGRYQVREEFANYASELAKADYIRTGEKARAVKIATVFLEESIQQSPRNARRYMYLASFVNKIFNTFQQYDPATAKSLAERNLILLQKAQSLSPTRPQIYFEKAQTLAILGRFEEGVTALQAGLELCPQQKEPHVDLVALNILAGRYDDAAREWQTVKALSFPLTREDYDRVLRSYNSKRQFAPMVELFKEQLEKTPQDAGLLAHLAVTYRELGEMELARTTAMKAAALSPELSTGLQSFLDSLKKNR